MRNFANSNWLFVVVVLVGGLIGLAASEILPPITLSSGPTVRPAGTAFQPAENISIGGVPSIVDGDTIEIHSTRIRLHGIDAPEAAQTCRVGGTETRCGQQAAFALADLIDRRTVGCAERDTDRYGRMVAVCHVGEIDLNAWLVENGWALAYRRYAEDYVPQERAARDAGRGIWAGAFVPPWDWRRGERGADAYIGAGDGPSGTAGTETETPSADRRQSGPCNIKGNISGSGERIYHMPGDRYYADTRIDTSEGERWFCTEDEARDEGWRRSKV